MRFYLLIPILTCTALLGLSASGAQAGSFLGPCCYGAEYTYRYPNRANSVLGCGPGQHCQAWHPLFRHKLLRRNQCVPNEGTPINATPAPPLAPPAKPSL